MKRKLIALLVLQLFCLPALAAGYSSFAIPTRIVVTRSEGFAIYGSYGNPGGCTSSYANMLFVRSDHPQYKQMYAAALAAFSGKYSIRAYIVTCQTFTWYANPPDTLNIVDENSVLDIAD